MKHGKSSSRHAEETEQAGVTAMKGSRLSALGTLQYRQGEHCLQDKTLHPRNSVTKLTEGGVSGTNMGKQQLFQNSGWEKSWGEHNFTE